MPCYKLPVCPSPCCCLCCCCRAGIVAGLLVQNTLKYLLHFGVVSKYLGYNRCVCLYGRPGDIWRNGGERGGWGGGAGSLAVIHVDALEGCGGGGYILSGWSFVHMQCGGGGNNMLHCGMCGEGMGVGRFCSTVGCTRVKAGGWTDGQTDRQTDSSS